MTKDGLANKKGVRSHRKAYFILGAILTAAMAAFPVILSVQAEGPSSKAAAPSMLAPCVPASFTNSTAIAISTSVAGNANPYPSTINVSGLLGNVVTAPGGVEVTLNGFSHTWPDDIAMVLVGPTGAGFLLQDGAGDDPNMNNVTYKLSDLGANPLPNNDAWGPGTYRPTTYYDPSAFPAPGPGSNYQLPANAGSATFASVFGGTAPNGNWSLFVIDFTDADGGQFAGGWTITITSDGCAAGSPSPTPSVSPSVSPSPSPSPSPSTTPPAGTVIVTGTNVGPIPDGVPPAGTCGPPLDIQFAVSGVTGPLSDIRVSFTGTHPWVGDLDVLLIAPGNAATQDIFTYTGNDVSGDGDGSDLGGTYNFFDTATSSWWAAAASVDNTTVIPPGNYRASNVNGQNVSLDSVFSNLGNPNGTWILRFIDCNTQDTGAISAATLSITGSTGTPTPTPTVTPTPTPTPTVTPTPSPSPVPSALDVNGRVIGSDGRAIRGALVIITGPGNFQRSTLTSSLGYYQFDSVPTGITYTITVSGKRYTFTSRNVPLTSVGAALQDFIGQPVPGESP